ncbi:MAG: EamA family transporter [Gaiellaceae bacterium]
MPILLVLGAVVSVQFGAALAATLFDELGAVGTVFLRSAFGALVLLALWRPRLRDYARPELGLAVLFGVTLAAMNVCFYLAIDRIPLGIAVTFEFLGPLGVAVAASRRALDLLWVALAGTGTVLLSGGLVDGLDALGVVLALLAGGFWAAYILLAARTGKTFAGGRGLALALALAALLVAPAGLVDAGSGLTEPDLLALGLAVALLSSVIPYSLELEALRRMPAGVFGVLMSLEPAVGALAGFLVLEQGLSPLEGVAIGFVVVASAGASLSVTAKRIVPEPV